VGDEDGDVTELGRPVGTPRVETRRSTMILVYQLLLVSLQVFLLVVAIEGLQGDDPSLARNAALLSLGVFGATLALRWFVRER
jgi:hypothetical protein